MKDLTKELLNKEVVYSKLNQFGFKEKDNNFIYKTTILNGQFEMVVVFSKEKNYSKLIDLETREDYILADTLEATGKFVGMVREEYNQKIKEIINECTIPIAFKTNQSKQVIHFIKEKYNHQFEFLWKNSNDAIVRNNINRKWYALLLTVKENRLTGNSDTKIEVLNVLYLKGKTSEIVDNKTIFYGYHMNKQSWITIKLENGLELEKICNLIDQSYQLSLLK